MPTPLVGVDDIQYDASANPLLNRAPHPRRDDAAGKAVADLLPKLIDIGSAAWGKTVEKTFRCRNRINGKGHVWAVRRYGHQQGRYLSSRKTNDGTGSELKTDHASVSTVLAIEGNAGAAKGGKISFDGAARDLELLGQLGGADRASTFSTYDLADRIQTLKPVHCVSRFIASAKQVSTRVSTNFKEIRQSPTFCCRPYEVRSGPKAAQPVNALGRSMPVTLGYTIFYVSDVSATLAFFEKAFGFAQRMLTPENDYGELESGSTTLAFVSHELASANLDDAGGFVMPDPVKPAAASITLVVDDVRSALNDAVAAGGRHYVEPITKPWGQTVAYVLGPDNILVELGTPVTPAG